MEFNISKIHAGWADMTFTHLLASHNMLVSYGQDTILYFAETILKSWNETETINHIYFNLETQGWVDLFLINYPSGLLKLEFYDCVFWDNLDYDFEHPPVPVFSALTTHQEFAIAFCEEMKKYAGDAYAEWGHPYPESIINQLSYQIRKGL